jgi:hypothetical protein
MLDDLRNSANNSYDDETPPQQTGLPMQPIQPANQGTFLGMTAGQRFVLALMLFMMVCVLGVFALIATEKIYLPFF